MVGVRQEILRAAETIFTRHDFHEVLMEDVAHECGVGKGTLYRYFPSKHDLYLAVMFEGIGALRDDLQVALRKPGEPAEKIKYIVRCILSHFWDRRFFFALIHRNEDKPQDPDGREWLRRRAEIVDIVQRTLEEAIAAGHMRALSPRIAAEMLLGMVRGVNRYHGRHDTLEDMVGAVVKIFWHGVAVDSPRVREHNDRKRRR
ncbi:MAG TPA: TetR/AcrR family transcriptional regulator [Candidatus Binatia bacterium]|jgi:AcrR family transcriptional regulator